MKDMWPITVDEHPVRVVLVKRVASDMFSPVHDEHRLARIGCSLREDASRKTGSNYKDVELHASLNAFKGVGARSPFRILRMTMAMKKISRETRCPARLATSTEDR